MKSPPAPGTFNYRSAVGMLQYLCNNTRPDCTFAVSQCARFSHDPREDQCARFSHDPREEHEIAIKRIGRYLINTKTAGIYFKPVPNPTLDVYVDAEFAGLYGNEDI